MFSSISVLIAMGLLGTAARPPSLWYLMKEKKWNEIQEMLTEHPDTANSLNSNKTTVPLALLYRGQETLANLACEKKKKVTLFEAAGLGRYSDLVSACKTDQAAVKGLSPDGFTALHLAAGFRRFDCVVYLLRQNAPLNILARSKNVKNSPCGAATFGGDPRCVEAILAAGADPDLAEDGVEESGFTPLDLAASNGSMELTKLLLRFGANPTLKTKSGKTARDFALAEGHQDVADLLKN